MNKNNIPLKTPGNISGAKTEKIDIIKILILAVISFLAGFALVFFFLRSPGPETPIAHAEEAITNDGSQKTIENIVEPDVQPQTDNLKTVAPNSKEKENGAAPNNTPTPATVPPGKTPNGISIDGEAFYLKCWDNDGVEHKGANCDRLPVLEKRFSTRLYVVDECRKLQAGDSAHGKLSVAAEVDFGASKINFWNGASSDIKKATDIASCIKTKLAGLPITGMEHKFSRYRLFFNTVFTSSRAPAATASLPSVPEASNEGRLVKVIKDRVRVRISPVDGEIIGKISTGNQIRLLGQKKDWCNILTPNNNRGWMICNALDL